MSRVITVFGATGLQGGGVVKALLAGGKFKVRGVTRSVEGKKAKELAAKGVEMVEATLDKPESLHKAIAGSHGVFLLTNFWDSMDGARETTQGKAAVDVCLQEGVKHLIYSGLESAQKMYGFVVEHFDSKTKVEDYMKEKAGSMIWNSVRMPAYMNNFLVPGSRPQKQEDGTYTLNYPMEGKPMYLMDVTDLGECVASIFNDPESYAGQMIEVSTEFLTIEQLCEVLSKVLAPRVFKDSKLTTDQFAKFGFPGAEEMAAMFKLYQKGIERDIALTKKLNPKAKSWEEFVVCHKADFESFL
ncbi:nmrA-like family domain-containing protein 1 [Dendronephthya gigantea]|uniref:nmrA-like family domain-containing protein 1 n=1 Tax=Dendronephthya gigantea TaxID=151771 RepID=UPI00106BD827|nr:nmrA-like family domain-containing protein 1 [Dendronephthya gigantea]